MNTPRTRKEPVTEVIHGHTIVDPYRWLEDGSSAETRQWIEDQNQYVDASIRGETFDAISNELVKNFKVTTFSAPRMRRGRYFFAERKPEVDHDVICFTQGLTGPPDILINPNGMNSDNTVSVSTTSASRSGKYLAYSLSEGGTETSILYVMEVGTRANLPDTISHCRYPVAHWLPDDSGFYYTRYPKPGTVPKNEEHLHMKVYLHLLGEDSMNDELIFGKDRPKDDMIGLTVSNDGQYLGITASVSWSTNDVYVYDRLTKITTPLVVGLPAKFNIVFLADRILITTNYKANNSRVLWAPIDDIFQPINSWKTFISEREHALLGIRATKNKVIAEYTVNACSNVIIFDYDGKDRGALPLPEYSTLDELVTNQEEEEFFYSYSTLISTRVIHRYMSATDTYVEYRKFVNPIVPEDYIVKQEWCVSKDGTKIPMFIFHRKNIPTGPNPLILYGYGGFGNLHGPTFNRSIVPWIERGGIYVIANIRGGGEFGKEWHESGIREYKQNSFDDFISAAEYIIKNGITDHDHIGIRGGSNGGLLVSAVEMQRPELCKAVCSQVPLTDMVRFPLFGMASRWVDEYGDPTKPEDLERMLKWSPYHNVKDSIEYPTTLFMTAENDTRVHPLHSRKMAALLQSVNKQNPVYCITDTDAGHGAGKPIKKIVESQALMLTFFAEELGLRV